jgi:hypothetical protein
LSARVLSRLPVIAGMSLALLVDILVFVRPDGSATLALDYDVFWTAARATSVYGGDHPFVNPPTALLWVQPLASLPYWPGFALWTGLSTVLFVEMARRSFGPIPAVLALASPLILKALLLGQTTLFLSAAILAAFAAPPIAGGVVLGIIASTKPQLLLLAPLALFIRRDWPMLIASVCGALGAVCISLVAFGPSLWAEWFSSLAQWHDVLVRTHVLSSAVAPAAAAEWHNLPPLPFLAAGIIIGCGSVIRYARQCENGKLAGLVVGASAIAAPYSLPHDLVVLAPLAVVALLRKPQGETIPAMLVFASALLPLSLPLLLVTFGQRDADRRSCAPPVGEG